MAKRATDAETVRLSSAGTEVEARLGAACLARLGWDTEGTGRECINLLASPATLRAVSGHRSVELNPTRGRHDGASIAWELAAPGSGGLCWSVALDGDGVSLRVARQGAHAPAIDRLEIVFPFDPTTTMTSVISSDWTADGRFMLPCVLSAPDLGQMLVTSPRHPTLTGRMAGSRSGRWLNVTFELPVPEAGEYLELRLSPLVLPIPSGYADERRWHAARRGWFNLIQQSCGASGGGTEVHGVWANNALSDPVSSVLYMLADATLLVPELAPGVSMPPILRRTVDYWLDHKTDANGLVAYTAGGVNQNVMDSNPAVLIGAWSYVKATGDLGWLAQRIEKLEALSQYMERRDVDGDGLIESKQSGNSGSRPPRDPDCAWDCYVSGHKNAYVNILAYRAWLGLADLEVRLGRHEQAERCLRLAERLKASFVSTFLNPATGWLGFWRSADGMLHDLYMDAPTSMAISYGLIGAEQGRAMLERYWHALNATGFARFDLGVPLNLRPVPRAEMDHYTEFQQFLNGGCGVSNTSYLLNAMYEVGMRREADRILDAMLKRQSEGAFANGGGFQNGFVDRMGEGAEVFDWNGAPAGYEGHLVYCWAFLHSMLASEPAIRARLYPPIRTGRHRGGSDQ